MLKRLALRIVVVIGALYLCLLALGSSLLPPVYTISSEIDIESTAEETWKVLTDFKSYGEWNPYLLKAEGILREGEAVTLTLISDNFDKPFTTTARFASVIVPTQFHWENSLLVTGIYDTRHYFVLEPNNNGQIRLHQYEEFRGLLAWLLNGDEPRKAAAKEGFHQMNIALKEKLEHHSIKNTQSKGAK